MNPRTAIRPARVVPTPEHVEPSRIVVAVGGRSSGDGALRWAITESARLGVPVQLVGACEMPDHPVPGSTGRGAAEGALEKTRSELDALAERVWASSEVLPVHAELGSPVETILRQATGSGDLLVLGHRDRRPAQRIVDRSTSLAVASSSPATVVVVPDGWSPAAHSRRPVVVGVDTPQPAEGGTYGGEAEVLGTAFERADDLDVALVAVHAWELPPLLNWSAGDVSASRDRTQRTVDAVLDDWRTQYPGVALTTRHLQGPAQEAVALESRGAQLVVLGRHMRAARHGGFHLGSTTRRLLQHTEVPVMVVPVGDDRGQPRSADASQETWAPLH